MKYQKTLLLSASCFLLALICSVLWNYHSDKYLAERIAPDILRFHVLANSNRSGDQKIKTEIKSYLLEVLQPCPASSKEEISSYIEEHIEALESQANDFLSDRGCDYNADICITQTYFPTKIYGDLVLPCGTYDTVQVTLGAGRGRNWWCVLYPRLCFVDASHGVLPADSRNELKKLLSEEDYYAVMETSSRIHIRLKLLEFLR